MAASLIRRLTVICSLTAFVLAAAHMQISRPLPTSVPERLGRAILGFERSQADPAVAGKMDVGIARWGFATQWWLADTPNDPGAHLARGVLLECLAHRAGSSLFSQTILPEDDRSRCRWASAADCNNQARRVYDRTIARRDGDTVTPEMSLRLARLESLDDPRRGQETLRELAAASSDVRLRYLATLFLGASAEARRESGAARTAYHQAMRIEPRWASARFAAATLDVRAGEIPSETLVQPSANSGPPDPFYGYSCTILTAAVADELASRQRRLFER